jgi:hypothetical protein
MLFIRAAVPFLLERAAGYRDVLLKRATARQTIDWEVFKKWPD